MEWKGQGERRENRTEQIEKLGCNVVLIKASADPTGSSEGRKS